MGVAQARRTHCPQGHPLDGRKGSGIRYCKTCSSAYARQRNAIVRGGVANVGRGIKRGGAAVCVNGHQLVGDNLRVRNGHRACAECDRAKARRAASRGSGYRKHRAEVYARFGGRCCYCRKPLPPTGRDTTIDHVVAKSNGGDADILNLRLACRSCNSRKGDK